MSPLLEDAAARDRIRTDLDATLVVEAAAGTGKTSELVRRIVAALALGRARLDSIVAVTFTEAAAGELKLRLRGAIEENRGDPSTGPAARESLTAALAQLEEARIGTIHAFCADLLRERPVEAGVDPLFEVAPEEVAAALFDRAFDRWFEATLAAPGEGVRRILRRRSRDQGPRALLRKAAWDLAERRDFPTAWRRAPDFARDAAIDRLIEQIGSLAAWAEAGDPEDYFTRSLVELRTWSEEVRHRESVTPRDHDGLEAEMGGLLRGRHWQWKGFRRAAPQFPKQELVARRDALRRDLEAFRDASGADLAPRLRDEIHGIVDAYEELKRGAGCLAFLDLLLCARNLVRDNAAVRGELQSRFTHLFVDEFQDTDPLQAEILLLLAADDPEVADWRRVRAVAGKLFLVGDPKQSIYRFRRADIELYEALKRQLAAGGAAVVNLEVSFRAVEPIQEVVNAAFAPRMTGTDRGEPAYVPLRRFRAGEPEQPAVVVLPVPEPYGDYGTVVQWKIEESLPDAAAAFVVWLVCSSGWRVTERGRPELRVPVEPRHVCLLFRRFRQFGADVTRPYVRALEARQITHLLVGGSSFHAREEIEAIRNACCAIERPEGELAVFATLRGPLFALSDSSLLAYRHQVGTLHAYRRAPEDAPEPVREVAAALEVLRELHRARNRRPFADTVAELLSATRAHAGLAIWPSGEQALANVSRLMDMARRAERHGLTSFRAFVTWLLDQAERSEASDAPLIEEGAGGVRLMTVHRAKGLEFPVVVLADLTAAETPAEPARWVDADAGLCAMKLAGCIPPDLRDHAAQELALERHEAARLLYVAATRARDLLVVPAVADQRSEGWLSALNPAIYPAPERARAPRTSSPPGCPAFGTEGTLRRPANASAKAGVSPGEHSPELGRHAVVWWDPAVLELGVQEATGLAQQKLLQADEHGLRAEAAERAYEDWRNRRDRVTAESAVPSRRVQVVTEHAASDGAAAAPPAVAVSVEAVGGAESRSRPHGGRFGTLVHSLLAFVDLDAGRDLLERTAEMQARLLGAPPEEATAAVDAVFRALQHALLRRAAAAARGGRCRREAPVLDRLPDGTLLTGLVDLAFLEEEPAPLWTVVDFKTDLDLAPRLEEYRRQVACYAEAIARATGHGCRAILLRV